MELTMKVNDPKKAQQYFEDKISFTTGPIELDYMMEQGAKVNVIDVRASEDYAKGHVPGAINLPEDEWQSLKGLQKDVLNVLYCYSHVCHLAARAAVLFAKRGFPIMEMDGGFKAWEEYDLAVESQLQTEQKGQEQQSASAVRH